MNAQIERSIDRIAEKARARYENALAGARRGTHRAAGRVTRGKKPVRTVSKFGVRLASASQRAAAQLIRQQTRLVEHQMDALSGRLRAAADAEDLREFLGTQIRLIPENASRFGTDARAALQIVTAAGGELAGLLRGTVAELKGEKPSVRRKPAVRKRPVPRKRSAAAGPAPAAARTTGANRAA